MSIKDVEELTEFFNKINKSKVARRKFIKFGSIFAVGYFFLKPLVQAYDAWVVEHLKKKGDELFQDTKASEYYTDEIIRLFGALKDGLKLIPGSSHHKYMGIIHPDDWTACALTKNAIWGDKEDYLEEKNLIIPDNFDANLFVFGSPLSNLISRQMLDYVPKTNNLEDGYIRKPNNRFFELPFEFLLDTELLYDKMPDSRKISEKSKHGVPNWSILDVENNVLLSPRMAGTDFWEEDYLLITVLPNILSKTAYDNEHKVINIGGSHGSGTKSIELLFKDKSILDNLYRETYNFNHWQALVKIKEVAYSSKTKRYEPVKLDKRIMCERVQLNNSVIERHIGASPKI